MKEEEELVTKGFEFRLTSDVRLTVADVMDLQ